ncbi:MAG: hypothetical protein WC632_06055 [Candidatus Margulisiibacteriota bacterium]
MLERLRRNQYLRRVCGLLLVLALYQLFVLSDPLVVDYHEYTDLARHIVAGQGYISSGFFRVMIAPSAFLQPVYTYLLAGAIFVFNSLSWAFFVIRLLQIIMLLGLWAVVYRITRELYGELSAQVSAFLLALYWPLITLTGFVWDTMLFCLLVALIVHLALTYSNRSYKEAAWLGLVFGVTVLTNAVVLAFVALLLVSWLVKYRADVTKLVVVMLVMVSVILPWSVRNSLVFRSFVPLRTGFWFNVYLGNNPDATGTIYLRHKGLIPRNPDDGITFHFAPLSREISYLNEQQLDQYLKPKALSFILSDIPRWLNLTARKVYYFWWFNPYEENNLFWMMEYAFILFGAAFGVYFSWRERRRITVLILALVAFTVVYGLTGPFFNWKYRAPLEPLLIILAGYGLVRLAGLWPGRSGQ